MNGMASNTTARRQAVQRLSLVAASALPGNASCCDALAEIFSPQWQITCACREDMRDQTTSQPASAMRRFARLASATCPSSATAPKPWTWQSCSLGKSTGHASVSGPTTPSVATTLPAAASAQVPAVAQPPPTSGPAVASTTPASLLWEEVLSAAGGVTGRKLLQSCGEDNCFYNWDPQYYGCPVGYGHCNGNTCTFGTAACDGDYLQIVFPLCQMSVCNMWPCGRFRCCKLTRCVACFPGSASVTLESGKKRSMSQLAIGDRVQVLDPTSGKVRFEEVYLFGHQLSDVSATFVKATLANGRVLTLSPDHFVPAVPMGKQVVFKNTVMMRGKDLLVGMHVYAADAEGSAASMVKHIGVSAEQGLFNPYTMGGLIVVDGVVASAHCSWVFDGVMDVMGLTHKIPALYQALFAPVRMLYRMLGAARMSSLAPSITDFGNALAEGDWTTVGHMACKGLSVLLAPALAGASVFTAYHVAVAAKSPKGKVG